MHRTQSASKSGASGIQSSQPDSESNIMHRTQLPSKSDASGIQSSSKSVRVTGTLAQPRAARLPNAVALGANICIFSFAGSRPLHFLFIALRPNQMLRFDKLNSLLPHHSLLCAWAVVSKDQFCEIKFAFDSSCAIVRLGGRFKRSVLRN